MSSKQLQTVLVVSETLTRGGLETRLLTQGRALVSRGHTVLYATSSADVASPLTSIAHKTWSKLAIGTGSSARATAEAAEQLANIIETEKVDVVHAHPYASLIAGAFGAALAGVPLTVTAHGPSSFAGGINFDSTLFDFVLPYAASIRVVSEEMTGLIPLAFGDRVHVMPNTVDLERFTPINPAPVNGPWAFVGRLDDGKSNALETLLRWAPQLGIHEVHVVGSGSEEQAIRQRIGETATKVSFIGWHDDVSALLRNGYAGVVGMGRVVLEAGALGLPCILAGYGQLHGVVTAERFKAFAFTNFSGRGMPAVEVEQLAAELAAHDGEKVKAVRQCIERGHDEAKLVNTNEALLASATVDAGARGRLLQLFATFRRAEASQLPWPQDHGLNERLRVLTRKPGETSVQSVLADANALIEAHANRTIADQQQQISELAQSVQHLQQQLEVTAVDRLVEKARAFAARVTRRRQ